MIERLKLFLKPGRVYFESYFSLHFVLIVSSFIACQFVGRIIDIQELQKNYVDILNGMGVLTSFFILALDKVDFDELKKVLKSTKINVTTTQIPLGKKIINTVFSMTISMFLLLGVLYIMLILGKQNLFLLILLIFYVFIGFLLVLVLWHSLSIK